MAGLLQRWNVFELKLIASFLLSSHRFGLSLTPRQIAFHLHFCCLALSETTSLLEKCEAGDNAAKHEVTGSSMQWGDLIKTMPQIPGFGSH